VTTLLSRAVREVFRREAIPDRMLWWFAAEGTGDWLSLLRDELAPHVEGIEHVLARDVIAPMHARRYQVLRGQYPHLPADEGPLVMGALLRIASYPALRWALPEAPARFRDHVRAERLIARIPVRARWEEVTCHLGELLIAMTERMPPHLPRVRPILGEICFAAGERFAKRFRRIFDMEVTPENALELLRMSEYVFRVNPDHWGAADRETNTGWLTGTACPWWDAPGWNGAHCGIFGQFQSGISSAFGLRYHLTHTIPKNGGHICRIDVKPIPLKKKDAA
jgi:hypothetical protein